jgi:hypothetical protein
MKQEPTAKGQELFKEKYNHESYCQSLDISRCQRFRLTAVGQIWMRLIEGFETGKTMSWTPDEWTLSLHNIVRPYSWNKTIVCDFITFSSSENDTFLAICGHKIFLIH